MSVVVDRLSYCYPGSQNGIFDVSFEAKTGELIAVIGASGCGKSTLLKLIAGLIPSTHGAVFLDRDDVTAKPVHERNVGMVFQNYALFPHLNVIDNVAYGLKLRKVPLKKRLAIAGDLLDMVGLDEFQTNRVSSLSGGQQQRVALARALAIAPRALLLDEPLAAVDATCRAGLRKEIRTLQKNFNATTLLITHDQEDALSVADRIVVLGNGKVIQFDSPNNIYEKPNNQAVAKLLGRSTLLHARIAARNKVDLGFAIISANTEERHPGDKVTVLVRPEHIVPDPRPNAPNRLIGYTHEERYLGSFIRYDFQIAGAPAPVLGEGPRAPVNSISLPPERAKKLFVSSIYALFAAFVPTASAIEGPEFYPGEKLLYKTAANEGLVVSFDTGPEWANWKTLFREFKTRYPSVDLTYNDIGSAATVIALDKSRRRPQADTAYYFAASGIDAVKKGVVAPFTPVNFAKLPTPLRDPQGKWFTIHTLNLAFVVNKKLVRNVPTSWADLLKSEYKNSIVYLDPRTAGVAQVAVFGAAYATGGATDNIKAGVDYFKRLHTVGNVMRVEATTPYGKFVKGEIPIWISYENDGLKAKHIDGMGDAVEVVIPKDGSVAAPYAISLVKNGPHPNAGKLWLNFIMSDYGQKLFAQGFVRPAVADVELPDDLKAKMLPAPQVVPLDVAKAAAKKDEIDRLYGEKAGG
ncbi:hypothetical protein DFQ28_008823 [Apophysomyces sp. BC1034]|nr:hypothetical protein DFQ28_008823 [Apophysomyces sp. BC1034]